MDADQHLTTTELAFGQDAAYDFLKNPRWNWREFLLGLVTVVVRSMVVLVSKQDQLVLSLHPAM